MRSIARLFARSPLTPLQIHMEKVDACMAGLRTILEAMLDGRTDVIEDLSRKVSKLEHEADLVKNDIRNDLRRGLFMSVDRTSILEILAVQDSIADQAEDIGVLLTVRPTTMFEPFKAALSEFIEKNLQSYDTARGIVDELDELAETGFGGAEAERVEAMVREVARLEHEADVLQRDLLRLLFHHEDDLTAGALIFWRQFMGELAALSNLSENLANRIQMILVR